VLLSPDTVPCMRKVVANQKGALAMWGYCQQCSRGQHAFRHSRRVPLAYGCCAYVQMCRGVEICREELPRKGKLVLRTLLYSVGLCWSVVLHGCPVTNDGCTASFEVCEGVRCTAERSMALVSWWRAVLWQFASCAYSAALLLVTFSVYS